MDIKIKKLLESKKIKYKILPHRKVYTAFTQAETQHIDPKTVVKTVFLKLSKPSTHRMDDGRISTIEYLFAAIPAGKRVDFKKVAQATNQRAMKSYKLIAKDNTKVKKPSALKVKMASEKDITKKLKTKVGLLHPFSLLFGLPLMFDSKLAKNKKLVVPAGSYTESLEITTKDFLKIMVGAQGNFTE